jgi:hypothetical protein
MKKTFMLTLVLMFGICAMGISTVIAGDYCPKGDGTGTPGYWKNHSDAWPPGFEITFDECPVDPLVLDKDAIIALMDGPVAGNKWITLFKAYVAALLNVEENGNCEPCCWWYSDSCGINLDTVYAWLADNCGTRVRANSDEWQYSHGEAEYLCLDDYNNGDLWMAISRDDLE